MESGLVAKPYWWEASPLQAGDPSPPDRRCDVAIIGAGYTGLAAAIVLARAGRSVQVFDAMRPGEGASTRNGGIASGNLRLSLSTSIARFGLERAVAMYREAIQARNDLISFIESEKIECDLQRTGRFTGAIGPAQHDAMKREADLLNTHLELNAYTVSRAAQHEEVGSDSYHGGMVRPDLTMVHPARLHAGMLKCAVAAGARIFAGNRIAAHRRDGDTFELDAATGLVQAGRLIVATNGYVDRSHPWLRNRIVAIKSRIVVTGQLPTELMNRLLPKRRAMGEARNVYRYYRPTPDGSRILLGARETLFSNDAGINARHVHRRLVEIFPEVEPYGIEWSWHGNVAFSRTPLPLLFEHGGAIHACGYCGSGVVWARWLGSKAAMKLLGSADAASVFDLDPPGFVPFNRGKPWFLPAVMAFNGFRDRLTISKARRAG